MFAHDKHLTWLIADKCQGEMCFEPKMVQNGVMCFLCFSTVVIKPRVCAKKHKTAFRAREMFFFILGVCQHWIILVVKKDRHLHFMWKQKDMPTQTIYKEKQRSWIFPTSCIQHVMNITPENTACWIVNVTINRLGNGNYSDEPIRLFFLAKKWPNFLCSQFFGHDSKSLHLS